MSYLERPRLHFIGRFQADVSTVNNDPDHFDDNRFLGRYQLPQDSTKLNGWWNPLGTGSFRIRDCNITGLVTENGVLATDPLLQGIVSDAQTGVGAKIVDLDPEQQVVSQIWGLRIEARTSAGALAFAGGFAPVAFVDLWNRSTTGGGPGAMGAMYQSILTDVAWGDASDSCFLAQLRSAATEGVLSMKFNVDGCDLNSASPTFTWGRVAGTIGVHRLGEPRHFVACRMLQPGDPPFNNVPAVLSEKRLTVDLGNSLPTKSPGGPLQDLGTLQIVAMSSPSPDTPAISLGSVSSTSLYDNDAGVVDLPLTAEQYDAAVTYPIQVYNASGQILAAERSDGSFIRADDFVFRLYPGEGEDSASTILFALTFGRPAAGVEISIVLDEVKMAGNVPEIGVPAAALGFPGKVTTGDNGCAMVTLRGHDPGNPRRYIDGQIYLVAYGRGGDFGAAAGNELSVLIWDRYDAPEVVTWVDNIHPIFQQYANLYPVMRSFLDLSSYHSVVQHRFPLQIALGLPIEDPNTMPVTRDLSPGKRQAILDWLVQRNPVLYRSDDVDSLRRIVQAAIEIEHATIPVYLSALFSIKPGANNEVAQIIRSVVVQEMLHLALACNLLNAIGGNPRIGEPGFVPTYPGHLPGSVRPDLVVTLRKCSITQIRDVFMAIEEPNKPLATRPAGLAAPDFDFDFDKIGIVGTGDADIEDSERLIQDLTASFEDVEHDPFTIGWFYGQIARSIIKLDHCGSLFTGDPDHQLTPIHWPGAPGKLYRITDKASALLAIHEIVREGEGTSHTDPIGDSHHLAHYYRFKEIVEGRHLRQDDNGQWVYDGALISFDPAGVFPMVDDPELAQITNPAARSGIALFGEMYTKLLASLHVVFNGQPDQLSNAIGLMFSLEIQARKIMQIPIGSNPAETAGPIFVADTFVTPPANRLQQLLGREKSGLVLGSGD